MIIVNTNVIKRVNFKFLDLDLLAYLYNKMYGLRIRLTGFEWIQI